jgi:copper resistance protein C
MEVHPMSQHRSWPPIRAAHVIRRRSSRRVAVAACLLLGQLVLPSIASAHAQLDTISPADKSSGPAPTEIVGTFLERPDPSKSSFAVVDSAGTVIVKGGTVPAADPKSMTLALPPLAPGAYQIRWTTISLDDGETAHGITTFTVVAEPSPSPFESASSSTSSPSVSLAPVPSPTASALPTSPASSSGADAIVPIVVALIVLAAIGAWLLRGRSRIGR